MKRLTIIDYISTSLFDEEEKQLISDVINDHAPIKSKRMPARPVPFMNSELRKEIHKKAMYSNKYFKMGRTNSLWEQYRKSLNRVTKLKTKSMKE